MGSKNVLKRMDPSEAGDGRHHMFSFPPMCCRRFAVTSLVFYLRTESEKNAWVVCLETPTPKFHYWIWQGCFTIFLTVMSDGQRVYSARATLCHHCHRCFQLIARPGLAKSLRESRRRQYRCFLWGLRSSNLGNTLKISETLGMLEASIMAFEVRSYLRSFSSWINFCTHIASVHSSWYIVLADGGSYLYDSLAFCCLSLRF